MVTGKSFIHCYMACPVGLASFHVSLDSVVCAVGLGLIVTIGVGLSNSGIGVDTSDSAGDLHAGKLLYLTIVEWRGRCSGGIVQVARTCTLRLSCDQVDVYRN